MKQSAEMVQQCACTQARNVARLVTRAYDDSLRPTGLTAAQLALLAAIDSKEASSIAGLSKDLFMDRTTLSRNLGPLVSAGWVSLTDEGRSRLARVTASGKAKIREAHPLWRQAQAALTQKLGRDLCELLKGPLERLAG
jgi:DNA-binding MarR family transcriptional regulator